MLLKFIFDRSELSEHMMTLRVEVALTLDGASSKTVGHVTARIKLVDSWCIDPLSGEHLFTACQGEDDDAGANVQDDKKHCNYQS